VIVAWPRRQRHRRELRRGHVAVQRPNASISCVSASARKLSRVPLAASRYFPNSSMIVMCCGFRSSAEKTALPLE
jgi:hypothetical protein